MEYLNRLVNLVNRGRELFWNPNFWLPPGRSWEDLEPNRFVEYTDYRDLYIYPFIIASVVLIFKVCLERFIFTRLGLAIGIRNIKLRKASYVPVLEKAYSSNHKWTRKDIIGLAKQLDWSERRVERWIRLRKQQGKPTSLAKFSEHCWRCFYYANMFVYGLVVLWDKQWFWDIDFCWVDYPDQGVTDDIWWYYMVSLSFYWSLLICQFFDIKRIDFWQIFARHIMTILLLSFSWICNLHRIGCLVLVLHYAADIILDFGKCIKYAKCEKGCTIILVFFVITWIVTRLVIFPLKIIRSAIFDAPYVANQMFPACYFFNGMLLLLFALHLYWTCLIFKLVYRSLMSGKIEGDIMSSDDNEIEKCSNSSDHTSKKSCLIRYKKIENELKTESGNGSSS